MSASREAQQLPLSLQEETQMSKCVINRLLLVLYCDIVLPILSMAVSYQK